MANQSRSSFVRVSRVLGTVGLASMALAWVAHRAFSSSRTARSGGSRPQPVQLRPVLHSAFRDGHLGAREKGFDWARTGRV